MKNDCMMCKKRTVCFINRLICSQLDSITEMFKDLDIKVYLSYDCEHFEVIK